MKRGNDVPYLVVFFPYYGYSFLIVARFIRCWSFLVFLHEFLRKYHAFTIYHWSICDLVTKSERKKKPP